MLEGLRKSAQTKVGRLIQGVFMALIIFGFSLFGIHSYLSFGGQSRVARVGATDITAAAFRQSYMAQLQALQNRREQNTAGLDRAVLENLLADAALNERARALGLAVSAEQATSLAYRDPAFRNASGTFDPNYLFGWLQQQGISQSELPNIYMRRQIGGAVAGNLTTPRLILDAINRYAREARSIEYAELTASSAGAIPPPSDADLDKLYQRRKDEFRAPEYRHIVVLAVTRLTLAKPETVSDADAQRVYDQTADGRYGVAERRTLQQLTFPTEAEARAALAKIKAGRNFQDIAKEQHLGAADIELGVRTKAQLGEIADAAFALPEGGVSEPIKTGFGYAVVRVVKITPGRLEPFAAVASQIKLKIAAERVQQGQIDDLARKVENLRSDGKPLAEVAKELALNAREIPAIDSKGLDKSGTLVADLVGGPVLLEKVFASDVGLDTEAIQTTDRGSVWFEIRKIEPARDLSFDEVKQKVQKAWTSDELDKRLAAKATDLVKQIDAGASLKSVLPGAEIKTADKISRSGGADLSAAMVAEVFANPIGMAAHVAGDHDNRFIFKVTGATVPKLDPDAPATQQLAAQLARELGQEVVRQYALKIEQELGRSVDAKAVRAAVGSSNSGGGEPVDTD